MKRLVYLMALIAGLLTFPEVIGQQTTLDASTPRQTVRQTLQPRYDQSGNPAFAVSIAEHIRMGESDNRTVKAAIDAIPAGEQGPQGDQGIFDVFAFQYATSTPNTPSDGSYNFSNGSYTPPAGWNENPPQTGTGNLYATRARIDPSIHSGTHTPSWSAPYLAGGTGPAGPQGPRGLQGNAGQAGQDGQDGSDGNPGAAGADGDDGWTPVIAVVSNGAERVLQVTDYVCVSGSACGTKPATGRYVGTTGLVTDINNAANIRGAAGASGSTDVVAALRDFTQVAAFDFNDQVILLDVSDDPDSGDRILLSSLIHATLGQLNTDSTLSGTGQGTFSGTTLTADPLKVADNSIGTTQLSAAIEGRLIPATCAAGNAIRRNVAGTGYECVPVTLSSLGASTDGEDITATNATASAIGLRVKRLDGGTNVTLTSSANAITINASSTVGNNSVGPNQIAGASASNRDAIRNRIGFPDCASGEIWYGEGANVDPECDDAPVGLTANSVTPTHLDNATDAKKDLLRNAIGFPDCADGQIWESEGADDDPICVAKPSGGNGGGSVDSVTAATGGSITVGGTSADPTIDVSDNSIGSSELENSTLAEKESIRNSLGFDDCVDGQIWESEGPGADPTCASLPTLEITDGSVTPAKLDADTDTKQQSFRTSIGIPSCAAGSFIEGGGANSDLLCVAEESTQISVARLLNEATLKGLWADHGNDGFWITNNFPNGSYPDNVEIRTLTGFDVPVGNNITINSDGTYVAMDTFSSGAGNGLPIGTVVRLQNCSATPCATGSGALLTLSIIGFIPLQAGAEPNVQADWNEAVATDDSFIQNKPAIPIFVSSSLPTAAEITAHLYDSTKGIKGLWYVPGGQSATDNANTRSIVISALGHNYVDFSGNAIHSGETPVAISGVRMKAGTIVKFISDTTAQITYSPPAAFIPTPVGVTDGHVLHVRDNDVAWEAPSGGGVSLATAGTPSNTLDGDGAASRGTDTTAAASDHVHIMDTSAFRTTVPEQSSSSGSAGISNKLVRGDHRHQGDGAPRGFFTGTPTQSGTSGSPGSATTVSRGDHQHQGDGVGGGGGGVSLGTTAPEDVLGAGGTAVVGSAATAAPLNHQHVIASAALAASGSTTAIAPLTNTVTGTSGTSNLIARQDHRHHVNGLPGSVLRQYYTGVANAIRTTGTVGTSTRVSPGDHVHPVDTSSGVVMSVTAADEGSISIGGTDPAPTVDVADNSIGASELLNTSLTDKDALRNALGFDDCVDGQIWESEGPGADPTCVTPSSGGGVSLGTGNPEAIASSASAGSATTAAPFDHVHPLGTASGAVTSVTAGTQANIDVGGTDAAPTVDVAENSIGSREFENSSLTEKDALRNSFGFPDCTSGQLWEARGPNIDPACVDEPEGTHASNPHGRILRTEADPILREIANTTVDCLAPSVTSDFGLEPQYVDGTTIINEFASAPSIVTTATVNKTNFNLWNVTGRCPQSLQRVTVTGSGDSAVYTNVGDPIPVSFLGLSEEGWSVGEVTGTLPTGTARYRLNTGRLSYVSNLDDGIVAGRTLGSTVGEVNFDELEQLLGDISFERSSVTRGQVNHGVFDSGRSFDAIRTVSTAGVVSFEDRNDGADLTPTRTWTSTTGGGTYIPTDRAEDVVFAVEVDSDDDVQAYKPLLTAMHTANGVATRRTLFSVQGIRLRRHNWLFSETVTQQLTRYDTDNPPHIIPEYLGEMTDYQDNPINSWQLDPANPSRGLNLISECDRLKVNGVAVSPVTCITGIQYRFIIRMEAQAKPGRPFNHDLNYSFFFSDWRTFNTSPLGGLQEHTLPYTFYFDHGAPSITCTFGQKLQIRNGRNHWNLTMTCADPPGDSFNYGVSSGRSIQYANASWDVAVVDTVNQDHSEQFTINAALQPTNNHFVFNLRQVGTTGLRLTGVVNGWDVSIDEDHWHATNYDLNTLQFGATTSGESLPTLHRIVGIKFPDGGAPDADASGNVTLQTIRDLYARRDQDYIFGYRLPANLNEPILVSKDTIEAPAFRVQRVNATGTLVADSYSYFEGRREITPSGNSGTVTLPTDYLRWNTLAMCVDHGSQTRCQDWPVGFLAKGDRAAADDVLRIGSSSLISWDLSERLMSMVQISNNAVAALPISNTTHIEYVDLH